MDKRLYEELFKDRPYFIWWVKNLEKVSNESAVEAILSNGDWDDVQKLFKILGMKRVAQIFFNQVSRSRNNYRKSTKNFFQLYFERNVS